MIDYDPTEEFVYLQRARLAPAQILAMLTAAPAARFGRANRTGRLAPGFSADVAVLDGDPARDVRAFAHDVRPPLRPHAALLHQHLTTVMAMYHEMETV